MREDFNSLNRWKNIYFSNIGRHSKYSAGNIQGISCLLGSANNSSSAFVYRDKFNVYKYPIIRWRWRVSGVYKKGRADKKSGDDFPARIHIFFDYDPKRFSLTERAVYNLYRIKNGSYPPDSALNYIWANRARIGSRMRSPYTKRAAYIVQDSGTKHLGQWRSYRINILRDYRSFFKIDPPRYAHLAVMIDADNTGESAKFCIDSIEVSSK